MTRPLVISVLAHKGGVGKSTATINVAVEASMSGRSLRGTLSGADVAFASTNSAAEIRAVGTKYSYSMRPPEGRTLIRR